MRHFNKRAVKGDNCQCGNRKDVIKERGVVMKWTQNLGQHAIDSLHFPTLRTLVLLVVDQGQRKHKQSRFETEGESVSFVKATARLERLTFAFGSYSNTLDKVSWLL
ncbi:hypothetical protein BaRGS_00010603 [Batillaria attramentaria]|uniref:Uncharacterized protein n=1 Tax=Batillaria attramentaria TaxID=370345 RepID=A0ABD0LF60_9CAEN